MILEKNSLINVKDFLTSLERAIKGVLRVSTKSTVGTGWLLTSNLVVIPDYFVNENEENDEFICNPYSPTTPEPVKAKLVFKPSGSLKGSSPALLELERSLDFPAQVLAVENCEVGDPVIILQHPGGVLNQQVSFGKIIDIRGELLSYNADTEPGSGGGPVINARSGKIIGMHVQKAIDRMVNQGISTGTILESLRGSPYWDSIIKYHKIADTRKAVKEKVVKKAPTAKWENIHLQTALKWNVKRSSLSEKEQEALKPHIVDARSPLWTLRPSDRQQILQSVSVSDLKKVKMDGGDQPEQRVINRILKGGPYNLEEVSETDLPFWLQAVRWFAPIDKNLPGSAEVNRVLEKKRVRSRLSELGGPDFKGRVKELKKLREWYPKEAQGPMVISGIGGIGKSALISNYALSLPVNTPLLWLDFDRADLAPDDAKSVLKILSEQIAIQVQDFIAPGELDHWENVATQLGENLSKSLSNLPLPLLVLDGFEVAQNVKQYQEIWKVLEFVIEKCPRLRVIVSGRAPVTALTLGGKAAESLHVKGMEPEDARAWLGTHGITNKKIAESVVEISKGIPLVLRLAVHYVDSGEKMEDLPETLPKKLIEGYLYQRILDRVLDVDLKPISREALILRKLTVDMIKEILSQSIPPGSTPEKVFEGLSREMGLVGENEFGSSLTVSNQAGVLQLRPEVRTATIKLLEMESPAEVKGIDQKAVNYYLKQDLGNFENVAELVYHLLRLGDLKEAQKYWQTECAPLLKYSVEDLPEKAVAERAWLEEKIGQVIGEAGDDIKIWELETLKQLKNLIGRGHHKGISEILKQRTERSDNSPLLLYDAWMAWSQNDLAKALELLTNSNADNPVIKRSELILRAQLEIQKGDPLQADHTLSLIDIKNWEDRKNGKLEILALQASRVRLTVSLRAELELAQSLKSEPTISLLLDMFRNYLSARDVVLPYLSERLEVSWNLESLGSTLKIPVSKEDLDRFSKFLNKRITAPKDYSFATSAGDLQTLYAVNAPEIEKILEKALFENKDIGRKAINCALQGEYRWKLATTSLILADFAALAIHKQEEIDPMEYSIVASIAAFRGQEMSVYLESFTEPTIDSFLKRIMRNIPRTILPPIPPERKEILNKFLDQEPDARQKKPDIGYIIEEVQKQAELNSGYSSLKFIPEMVDEKMGSVLLYLIGPDPLEMLCRRIIGLPDNYKF